MARTPLTEREKQLLEEGKRNTALRAAGQATPAPAPSVADPNQPGDLSGPVEKIGTATRVGDRLYGSATGVTPETVDKAKSYLSTQSALNSAITNPKSSLSDWSEAVTTATKANDEAKGAVAQLNPAREMKEFRPGVSMNESTRQTVLGSMFQQNDMKIASRPDYAKANEAINRMVDTKRDRENKGGTAFQEGVAKWNDTLQTQENDRMIAQKTQKELSAANREYSDARVNRSSLVKAQREGKVLDPELFQKANERLAQADRGRGYGVDSEQQSYLFEDMIRGREGIPLRNPSLRRRRLNPNTVGFDSFTTTRTPGGMGS